MMKYFIIFSLFILYDSTYGQNITGQWKGEFIDKSTGVGNFGSSKCEYVLELDIDKTKVIGTSYTYFTQNGKKFYTICKVNGFIDFKKKYLEISETERTKTNIPNNISNCLQVHKLTYFKKGNTETLDGNWMPIPNQKGNCGFGTTVLTRRSLIETYPNLVAKKPNTRIPNAPIPVENNKNKNTNNRNEIKKNEPSIFKKETVEANQDQSANFDLITDKKEEPISPSKEVLKIEKRKSTILKTIEIENKIISIDIYDNGEVDGDSISLFYNKKLLLSNRKLSENAISLTLNIENENDANELIMYAENLGTIPPNTALMVITDGKKRYEIRITSDLEKSGVIKFLYKSK